MKILALEFSCAQRSVALLEKSDSPEAIVEYEVIETGDRSGKPFAMIEEALSRSGTEREQVERVAIGLGPGSYTGIRAAIALSQGWQLATETPLQGVSSAECIAAQAQLEGLTGSIAIVVDAQRGEFYLGLYELTQTDRREVTPLRLASAKDVLEHQERGDKLVGPEVLNWFPKGRTIFPRAATLARLALCQNRFTPGEELQPIYLRAPSFVKAPPPRMVPGLGNLPKEPG